MSAKVKLTAKTWKRDSYGLYDYETEDVNVNRYTITSSGRLYRNSNHEINFVDPEQISLEKNVLDDNDKEIVNSHTGISKGEYLLSFSINRNGEYCIRQSEKLEINKFNELYVVLNQKFGNNNNSIQIQEGNFFKIGRILFKVLRIKLKRGDVEINNGDYYKSVIQSIKSQYFENTKLNFEYPEKNVFVKKLTPNIEKSSNFICRFCLGESEISENPLIDPCKCKGTMQYVHFFCLQTWLLNKINLKNENGVINVNWQNLVCELCKEKFPIMMSIQSKTFDIFELSKLELNTWGKKNENNSSESLILESYTKENTANGLHFLDFSDKSQITIGRGTNCEIRIHDISVSRLHCKINMLNGKFFLQDNNSKFGTLYQIPSSFKLESQMHLFQCGRTSFEIFLTKPFSSYIFCLGAGCSSASDNIKKKIEKNELD